MKKFFRELISDDNQINEQAFVGVISFFAMVFVLLTDVITGVIGNELVIKEFSSLKAARAFSRILILRNVAREAMH
jgi:ABC-type transport system involved in multi-copper enzyme maturation permease subunit